MIAFISELYLDLRRIGWRSAGLMAFVIVAVYGLPMMNPTTAYDFSAAKGDPFQVFLSYFFMRRITQGIIAGLFHDFTPMWNWAVGLFALFVFANLLLVLCLRLKLTSWQALAFVILWLSAPFFFNRSIYQHAMPAEAIAFCFDAVIILLFVRIRDVENFRSKARFIIAAIFCGGVVLGVYQAHANLLLTAMLGVCCISPRHTWYEWGKDVVDIVTILAVSVFLWAFVNYGPIFAAKVIGITFPRSGGAHDTVYWIKDSIPFAELLVGLFVGLILNFGYNAFFVVGLRWVIVCMVISLVVAIYAIVTKKRIVALCVVIFLLSIFFMPCLQCSSANIRIFFCFSPFIAFSCVLLLKYMEKRKVAYVLCVMLTVFAIFSLAHETSTLYYYNWKTKKHDELHMSNVATDIWRIYGLVPSKPVAVIGGWSYCPTCWEDMRPNSDMPLLSRPFTTYSNMTDRNVPREFYMVAREKVGLVVDMPSNDMYEKAKMLKGMAPSYPQSGYIFEKYGLIIVNLGEHAQRWKRFNFKSFRSPNEQLLFRTLREDKWVGYRQKVINQFASLAKKYPWTVVVN